MYKAGDKFVIVESAYLGDCWKAGNIVEFIKQCDNVDGVYEFKKPGSSDGYFLNFGIDGETRFHSTVRPLRTEAEKRGAKFGVGGVLKHTGERLVFISGDSFVWRVIKEGSLDTQVFMSFEIRLDHEPEYKETPFSEGTHEQRMDAGNLWYRGSPVVQISHFPGSGYAFTIKDDFEIRTNTKSLTIRIPTCPHRTYYIRNS